jgi:hypothetical protein
VGEFVVGKDKKRWEFQLKGIVTNMPSSFSCSLFLISRVGGGTTPFCRTADGRAVLRSSVREFLASEAMFHLGVSTTRALSLVVSHEEIVMRPWYSKHSCSKNPGISLFCFSFFRNYFIYLLIFVLFFFHFPFLSFFFFTFVFISFFYLFY